MSGTPPGLSVCWRPVFDDDATEQQLDLPGGARLNCSPRYARVTLPRSYVCLSSAVLNGGLANVEDFLNMRVNSSAEVSEAPQTTLARYAQSLGCGRDTVGMMTAASMGSLRVCSDDTAGEALVVIITTGLENARRAGDPADYHDQAEGPPVGTINLAIVSGLAMPVATMTEIITVATEAKTAVLQELEIHSPISGGLATGTGTDAIAVFAPGERAEVVYAGKHTVLGERIASLVMTAARDSIGDWVPRSQGEAADA